MPTDCSTRSSPPNPAAWAWACRSADRLSRPMAGGCRPPPMTGHGDIPRTVRAMKAGAIDFLTKPFRDQDMLDAVTAAIERDRTSRNEAKILSGLKARFATLTAREREVMALVTSGLMNKQIA